MVGLHRQPCIYRGNSEFPCLCQPPTLFGHEKRWYCDCCGEPSAMIRYGLCDLCESHQYSSSYQARTDHEIMNA